MQRALRILVLLFASLTICRVIPAATVETLFASSTEQGTISTVNLSTNAVTLIATIAGTAEGITCGQDGKLYVALSGLAVSPSVPGGGPRRIIRMNYDGTGITTVLDFATTPALASSGGPEGPSFNAVGELFFATRPSQGFPHTGVWRLAGSSLVQIILPFTNQNAEQTAFLTAGPYAGHLVAVGSDTGVVVRRPPPFTSPQAGTTFITGLSLPNGLALNSTGDILVASDASGAIARCRWRISCWWTTFTEMRNPD